MASIIIDLTAENIGRIYEFYHLVHTDTHLGYRLVRIKIVNNTTLTLNRTVCGDDDCSWIAPQGHTEQKPAQVLQPASTTSCEASPAGLIQIGSITGIVTSAIEYTPTGSSERLFRLWFRNGIGVGRDKNLETSPYWSERGYRAIFREEQADDEWHFAIILTQVQPCQTQEPDMPLGDKEIWGSPCAVTAKDQIHVFYRGLNDQKLRHMIYRKGKWESGYDVDGTKLTENPSAVLFHDDIWVFHRASDGDLLRYNILHGHPDGTWTWDKDTPVGGIYLSCSPSAIRWNDMIVIAYQSAARDGTIYYLQTDGSGGWSPLEDMGGNRCSDSPALFLSQVGSQDVLACAYQGQGDSQRVFTSVYFQNSWREISEVHETMLSGSPKMLVANKKFYLLHQGRTGNGMWCNIWEGGWKGDTRFTNVKMTGSPAATVLGDKIYCFHAGDVKFESQLWCTVFRAV